MNNILLTIDVEDWFQVENFKPWIPFSSWPSRELRVEKNTHRLLDLLDAQQSAVRGQGSVSTNSTSPDNVSESFRQRRIALSQFHQETEKKEKSRKSRKSCLTRNNDKLSANSYELGCQSNHKATFFVLGWIAKRLPHLVREIQARGHEVASHGFYHNLCNQQSVEELKRDLTDSKKLLEDIIGSPVFGYRAPSFAINNDILKIIEDCDYLYDSSYNSFAMHSRYGHIDISQNGRKGIAIQISKTDHATSTKSSIINSAVVAGATTRPSQPLRRSMLAKSAHQSSILYELPISNLELGNHVIPWGGGGYFRLIPLFIFKMGIKAILKKENDYLFYMHPWEVDPEQPRVDNAPPFFKFRHYVNLDKTVRKLSSFMGAFKSYPFITCHQYLENLDILSEKNRTQRCKF